MIVQQQALFAPPARCPSCGSPAVVAVDLDLVGSCRDCEAVLWRDDESSEWERFTGAFGAPPAKPKRKRQRTTLADFKALGAPHDED